MVIGRRALLAGMVAVSVSPLIGVPAVAAANNARMRVIIDNDLGGDPDSLFQLVHFASCRSVAIPMVIGTHYKDFGAADLIPDKSAQSARKAEELLAFLPEGQRPPVMAGADQPLTTRQANPPSPATSAIIQEAMRSDVTTPLFYAAGGSLTQLALAWLTEPAIGKRLKLVWIGGNEHPGLGNPPAGPSEPEYNFSLDRVAAQIIFNESDIEIWQIPRNAFRQMLVGLSELEELAAANPLGRYLHQQVVDTEVRLAQNLPAFIFSPGETYMLGDTALVTLTALQTPFQPDTASSSHVVMPTPSLALDGSYSANPAGRPMRVYTAIDAHLTWRNFAAKLRLR